ncbi:MAG TPA: hypothetical protein VIP05_19160, partial [Burkholderiaceae bacterium]
RRRPGAGGPLHFGRACDKNAHMPAPDNRPVQQMIVVVAVIFGATLAAAFAFGKWAVLVPLVLIPAWRFSRSLEVTGQIVQQGWSGRRFKDYWVYEEKQGKDKPSLSFKLERAADDDDRFLFVVPDEASWRRTMPEWALARRREIVARVASAFPAEDVRWPPGEAPDAGRG